MRDDERELLSHYMELPSESTPYIGPTSVIPPNHWRNWIGEWWTDVCMDRIRRRFGEDGGIFRRYLCGEASFGEYKMRCDIQGDCGYCLDELAAAVGIWDNAQRWYFRNASRVPTATGVNTDAFFTALRERVMKLKYEMSKMNSEKVDSI